jgi:pimeloyl-ACP methyl ester carboxylesterase
MSVAKRPSLGQLIVGIMCPWGIYLASLLFFAAFSGTLFAAEVDKPEEKAAAADKTGAAAELPKPEDITLTTADGLRLAITYYPGTKGKQTIPVVLLHAWKRNRTDFPQDLARFLQTRGCAVVVPDLRGHGESTRLIFDQSKEQTLNAATMPPGQFGLMVTQDMKAVKEFLWERNNAGELNLDKLCVVGAEMGASVAVEFALYDAVGYDQGTPKYGPLQLGRFVKALVLISPELSFKGLSLRRALQNPAVRGEISVLIMVGKKDERALEEAERIHTIFEREHPAPEPDKAAEQQTLFFSPLDTNLQGANIFAEKNLLADDIIAAFIQLRLEKSDPSRNWVWKVRKLPHQ